MPKTFTAIVGTKTFVGLHVSIDACPEKLAEQCFGTERKTCFCIIFLSWLYYCLVLSWCLILPFFISFNLKKKIFLLSFDTDYIGWKHQAWCCVLWGVVLRWLCHSFWKVTCLKDTKNWKYSPKNNRCSSTTAFTCLMYMIASQIWWTVVVSSWVSQDCLALNPLWILLRAITWLL